MQIVILAGGEGSRLRPLTSQTPKPLVKVLGMPVIERLLSLLFRKGFKKATIADFYLADKLEQTLGSFSCGIEIEYMREDTPLGTAGCVRRAWNGEDDVLVVSGDSVCDFDFKEICRFHKKKAADVTIVTHRVADPREYGLVTADEKGRVIGFLEKPGYDSCLTDVANTGTYVISSDILGLIPKDEKLDFAKDIFPGLLADNRLILSFPEDGIWHDIGDISSLLKCQRQLLQLEDKERLILKGAEVSKSAVIGAQSVIEQGAFIGADCRVQGALIQSGSSVGEGCSFSSCVIGENVTIGRGCSFGELSVIGSDCVIGSSVKVDSGVRVECGLRIPSGAHIRTDLGRDGYMPMQLGDYGEVLGIRRDETSLLRLGMAISTGFSEKKITVGTYSEDDSAAEALILGLRSCGTKVYLIKNAAFGQTVFSARHLKTKYAVYVGEKIRIIRSDRIELARSEERIIEQSYNRSELKNSKSAPLISAEAEASLYLDELASLLPTDINAEIVFKTDSLAEGMIFSQVLQSRGLDKSKGERIVFHSCGDGKGIYCSLSDRDVPYEKLLLLGCKAHIDQRNSLRLPQSVPLACEELAEAEGISIVRVSATDDLELTPFCYDSLMLIAGILSYLTHNRITMSYAVSMLPDIVYSRRTVAVEDSLPKLLGKGFDKYRKGKDIILESDGARAYLRPAKSGRSLSMYVESVSMEAADLLCDEIVRRVKDLSAR